MPDAHDAQQTREGVYKQAAALAGLSLGSHTLVLTGALRVARELEAGLSRAYLRSLASVPQYAVVFGVLIIAAAALGARAWNRGARRLAWTLGALALLIPAEMALWLDGSSPGWQVLGLCVAALAVSGGVVVRGTRGLLQAEQRAIMLILGMLVFDLGSDLPSLLTDTAPVLSRINNDFHNDTLVHTFWLPLSLLVVLASIGYHLWRRRRWEDIARALLGVVGAGLLYGIVEPKEHILETLPSGAPEATPLLHAIGGAHIGSVLVVLAALALLNHRAVAVARQVQRDP